MEERDRKNAIEGVNISKRLYVYVCEIQGITNTKQTERKRVQCSDTEGKPAGDVIIGSI